MIKQTFTVPLKITLGVRKFHTYWISMNNYHNWHFQVRNNIKKLFTDQVDTSTLTKAIPPIQLIYSFYYPNLSHRDIGNSLAVVDKFTADALVLAGIIPDDNYTIVQSIVGEFGGIDKANPRCEVTIVSQQP
jgi:hypothetical protein